MAYFLMFLHILFVLKGWYIFDDGIMLLDNYIEFLVIIILFEIILLILAFLLDSVIFYNLDLLCPFDSYFYFLFSNSIKPEAKGPVDWEFKEGACVVINKIIIYTVVDNKIRIYAKKNMVDNDKGNEILNLGRAGAVWLYLLIYGKNCQ